MKARGKKLLHVFMPVLVVCLLMLTCAAYAATVQARETLGYYALELDGIMVGWLFSAEGGTATGIVVNEKIGPDRVIKKHIAGIRYEDITVTCGTGMTKGFYEWLKDTLNKRNPRKNGAIIQADSNGKEVSRLNFTNAMITQIIFPAPDAASKDAIKMTITITPQYTQQVQGSGKALGQPMVVQKKWIGSNFRLTIAGLDTTKVNKIDTLVFKQAAATDAMGSARDSTQIPIQQEIPNLVITLPEVSAQTFRNWYGDFVIKGNNGDAVEKNGTLEYLSPNFQETYFTLTFRHIGIFRLAPQVGDGDTIRRLKAEMYVEDMAFDYSKSL